MTLVARPEAGAAGVSTGPADGAIDIGRTIAGFDPHELVGRFGSPLYVYDLDVVTRRVERLRQALPAGADVAYAVKANPSLAVVSHLARLGLGADVASGGELETALRAGVGPAGIVFGGPGKTGAELERAARVGVGAVAVESMGELERLRRIAATRDRPVGILLRVSTASDWPVAEETPVIGAGIDKFGLGIDELDAAVELAQRSPGLDLLGLHAFGATNVLDAARLAAHVAALAGLAERLACRHGIGLRLIDAGGGLGIPYAEREPALDVDALGRLLAAEMDSWATRAGLERARLLLEPGRHLVGPAGAYVATVVATKDRAGRRVAVLDGGIHHLTRPALIAQPHRIRPLGEAAAAGGRRTVETAVVGPLCTGLDVLDPAAELPDPVPGDLLAILDAGAYGFTEAMPAFLSHPAPAEIGLLGGAARLLRPRQEPLDVLGRQHQPW